MKVFDAHCHLQDPRIVCMAPELIESACQAGVIKFAVNGTHEKDWHLVKQLSEDYPCTIPNFGLHPWFVADRSPNWFQILREYFEATPCAAVGEIGLDKGSHEREINFNDQVEVFKKQLELAKELNRPASVHCVSAFDDLLQILKEAGPFPAGIILHSYMGSAEMVPQLVEVGAYFSFSGHLMPMKEQTAKKMLKVVPFERILLETDAPDALPKNPAFFIDDDVQCSAGPADGGCIESTSPTGSLNHPANILVVLNYVASLLDMPPEDLAELSCNCKNAVHLFSYEGTKLLLDNQ
ncbi:hypothetical protein EUGRSUZ_F01964 [Eucalyptus grandis]|uniref:TatD related DNase n=2 Tax=Eucalyptus grandis TaxID=71139 RepID=A0A059BQI6_EUCGR|nr:hypothetical protein EUGRSUZ_F01964 [Eucalyptus grandis]